jgi:hypothetical protein
MRIGTGWRGALFLAFIFGSTISGCNCGGDDQGPIIRPPPATTTVARKVAALFVDAATGAMMTDRVSVAVRDGNGAMSTVTRDGAGAAKNAFTVDNGIVSFQVDAAAPLPVHLTLVATAQGYNATSANLDVTADGAYDVTARMVSVAHPPAGVTAVQEAVGTASASGTISAPIALQTPAAASTGTATTFTVPANTTITTAGGRPLTGALEATVANYSNMETSSLMAFPGGLEVSVPLTSGAAKSDVTFISGGFAAITVMDVAGNVAAHFSQPVAVQIGVPASTVNPMTGALVAAGDTIPLWSYSEVRGEWQPEGEITIAADAAGNLLGTGSVNHLSYYNLDWTNATCATPPTVTISGNTSAAPLMLELMLAGGGYAHSTFIGSDTTPQLLRVPARQPMRLTARYKGQAVGSVDVADICSSPTLTVSVPTRQLASVEVDVLRTCEEDHSMRAPVGSATVVIYDGSTYLVASTDAKGKAVFNGLDGGFTYGLYGYTLDGKFIAPTQHKLAAGSNKLELPVFTKCAITGLTGGQGN